MPRYKPVRTPKSIRTIDVEEENERAVARTAGGPRVRSRYVHGGLQRLVRTRGLTVPNSETVCLEMPEAIGFRSKVLTQPPWRPDVKRFSAGLLHELLHGSVRESSTPGFPGSGRLQVSARFR